MHALDFQVLILHSSALRVKSLVGAPNKENKTLPQNRNLRLLSSYVPKQPSQEKSRVQLGTTPRAVLCCQKHLFFQGTWARAICHISRNFNRTNANKSYYPLKIITWMGRFQILGNNVFFFFFFPWPHTKCCPKWDILQWTGFGASCSEEACACQAG